MNEDLTFLVLHQLQANPKQTQLQRSQAIGISAGRTNDVVRALIVEKPDPTPI
ncbi:winged helix-turn-helix domain-containing protein [Lamprobacter modestohalophilus]|uniref:winged helix-turn-helix domain-containing protein n=1 Tax=Lamprobacter modestohalophilus TaxID=1064514 RepID=UPI00190474AE|nr:winged helix-turn-helix domain-containing protein [Lamprobacter modestohalophilus]